MIKKRNDENPYPLPIAPDVPQSAFEFLHVNLLVVKGEFKYLKPGPNSLDKFFLEMICEEAMKQGRKKPDEHKFQDIINTLTENNIITSIKE